MLDCQEALDEYRGTNQRRGERGYISIYSIPLAIEHGGNGSATAMGSGGNSEGVDKAHRHEETIHRA